MVDVAEDDLDGEEDGGMGEGRARARPAVELPKRSTMQDEVQDEDSQGGGRQRKAGEKASKAPRSKKMKVTATASQWHEGEALWLSFEAARTFVRTLEQGSREEWKEYSKSSKRPTNIPGHPNTVYRDAGWISWPDWMGYEGTKTAKGSALSFEAARTFVRTLKLGRQEEWREYCKSGKRPCNVPGSPDTAYRDAGWISWPDWMGYEGKIIAKGKALSFEVARTFVRTLKLGRQEEWREYRKSGKCPSNIPCNPDRVYRDAGWVSMNDWMGYEPQKFKTVPWLSFEAARTFVRTLELGSQKDWHLYSKSSKRPSSIPTNPCKFYRDAGWVSMPDWMGYGGQSGGGAAGKMAPDDD